MYPTYRALPDAKLHVPRLLQTIILYIPNYLLLSQYILIISQPQLFLLNFLISHTLLCLLIFAKIFSVGPDVHIFSPTMTKAGAVSMLLPQGYVLL